MDCFEARAALWPPERPRLADADVTGARDHTARCPECQAYFAQDRMLLDSYDRIRRARAPRSVRERVFDALAHERAGAATEELRAASPDGRPWRGRLATAAMLVAALGSVAWMTTTEGPLPDEAMFVEDYLRRAVGADHIESSDPAEVTRFLTRELGVAVAPIEGHGLELLRAEICLLEGRRGAMIVYKREGEVISHYMVPREGGESRSPAPGRTLEGAGGAPAVITWASPSLEQALVGDVSTASLMGLAGATSVH